MAVEQLWWWLMLCRNLRCQLSDHLIKTWLSPELYEWFTQTKKAWYSLGMGFLWLGALIDR